LFLFLRHALHVSTCVPGFALLPLQVSQVSSRLIEISFVTPKNDSSKVISISYFKSLPFLGPALLFVFLPNPEPPKNDEKISPMSPKSPNPSNPELEYE
jgi:hypothetical protein